jgi:hypothetical protein
MTSLQEDMESLFSQREQFHDVILACNDGERVPAYKAILGARSSVFRHMFLSGQFKEAAVAEVELQFPGRVMRLLVSHCYTDNICDRNAISIKFEGRADSISYAMAIICAADFFDMQRVKDVAIRMLCRLMARSPSHAAFIMCYIKQHAINMNDHDLFADFAWGVMRLRPKEVFTKNVMQRLVKPSNLEWFITEFTSQGNEIFFCDTLMEWAPTRCTTKDDWSHVRKVAAFLRLDEKDIRQLVATSNNILTQKALEDDYEPPAPPCPEINKKYHEALGYQLTSEKDLALVRFPFTLDKTFILLQQDTSRPSCFIAHDNGFLLRLQKSATERWHLTYFITESSADFSVPLKPVIHFQARDVDADGGPPFLHWQQQSHHSNIRLQNTGSESPRVLVIPSREKMVKRDLIR